MRILISFTLIILFATSLLCQNKPYRVGTTTANFLEMGIGSSGIAMGEAYVSVIGDLSSIYWNPSGLAYVDSKEAQFMYQPWVDDIKLNFGGIAIPIENIGTFAIGFTSLDYGSTEVTTMTQQEGTGEIYSAMDLAISFAFARKLADWFAFGAAGKYVSSKISRLSASSLALDLGVMINTDFLSPDGDQSHGLTIGMSISNYGTQMQYEGIELLNPIDIAPNENGNYKYVQGEFKLESWDIPLMFRLGVSFHPILTSSQTLTLAVDALHPNNNSESLNVGAEYQLKFVGLGDFYFRGGWHGLFMNESQYGLTLGGGIDVAMLHNVLLKIGYAYQDVGVLGNFSSFTFGIVF